MRKKLFTVLLAAIFATGIVVSVILMTLIPIEQVQAICSVDQRFSLLLNLGRTKFDDAVEESKNVPSDTIHGDIESGMCMPPGTYKLYIL